MPTMFGFLAFCFGFKSPWIDEDSGHHGRRLLLYQERRRTWSVVADGNMTKNRDNLLYSTQMEVTPKDRKVGNPGNSGEHIHGTYMGGFVGKEGEPQNLIRDSYFPYQNSIA